MQRAKPGEDVAPGRDQVVKVPDWLFEPGADEGRATAEALLGRAAAALVGWDGAAAPRARAEGPAAAPVPLGDDDDLRDTAELERVAAPRRFSAPRWWAVGGLGLAAGVALTSALLQPGEPQVLQCPLPLRTPDAVVAAVSAPALLDGEEAPALAVKAPRGARPAVAAEVQALLDRGDAFIAQGRYWSAAAQFRKARKLAPKNPDAWYGQALCFYEKGERALASASAAWALALDPEHSGATVLLGFIAQETGAFASSRQLYQDYLAHAPQGEWAGELRAVLERLPGR